jgi:guanylate kinase
LGHIYALGGPSGVGKTTFMEKLFSLSPPGLQVIPRATGRSPRLGERDGFDYSFYSESGFLQKIFSNDFIHVEQFGNSFYGIEAKVIEDAIRAPHDSMIMAGIYGATRLRDIYGKNISVLFMYSGTERDLLSPACLSEQSSEIREIIWRLREKVRTGVAVVESGSVDDYVNNRMSLNLLSLAYVNGRMRSGDSIKVVENEHDRLDRALEQFLTYRQQTTGLTIDSHAHRNTCFVLMPFRDDMTPIFDDHIAPVVGSLGLHCTRADRIFSNRAVMTDVLDAVRTARVVISDLTHANPNVFYETGICHALGKEVVLLTQDEDVPFDLRHIRQIRYKYTPPGMKKFNSSLESTIKALLFR